MLQFPLKKMRLLLLITIVFLIIFTHRVQPKNTGKGPVKADEEIEETPPKNTGDLSACNLAVRPSSCDSEALFRTFDGSCNNLNNPTWGQAGRPYDRLLSPAYEDDDQIRSKTHDKTGDLPSARKISSNILTSATEGDESSRVTAMLMLWGQFIAHDFVLTPLVEQRQCCGSSDKDCIPISIPNDDVFWNGTRSCMELRRSKALEEGDCGQTYREQLNLLTSYLDGSVVYGSSKPEADSLRTFTRGQMSIGSLNDLPPDISRMFGFYCNIPATDLDQTCTAAGDPRNNEWHGLTSLHVVFLRLHNNIASKLYNALESQHQEWGAEQLDERAYQETRRIIGAILQVITYNDYLPIVLGKGRINQYGLNLGSPSYDMDVDATVVNVFATSAFRFGHSEIPHGNQGRNKSYHMASPFMSMVESFNSRDAYLNVGQDNAIRGLVIDPALPVDSVFAEDVKDRLFERNFDGFGLDLPAINIQRARDHGIRSYNDWRRYCSLPVIKSFSAMSSHDQQIRRRFASVYTHPDDIDLFIAAVTERPVSGDAEVGPTVACLLGLQFKKMKDGDRFWFENQDTNPYPFSSSQISQLSSLKLARILCETTDIDKVPDNVFLYGSKFVNCDQLPTLELDDWL